jgi:hypothetical protein
MVGLPHRHRRSLSVRAAARTSRRNACGSVLRGATGIDTHLSAHSTSTVPSSGVGRAAPRSRPSVPPGDCRWGPFPVLGPLQRVEPMAESVDSLAVAVERSNIFAVPLDSRESAGTSAEPARTMGVFARVGSSSAPSEEAPIPEPVGRFSLQAASRWVAAGVSTRGSVCVAVVVAAVMAALVLYELGEPGADPRVQINTRPAVGVEAPSMRAGAARQRGAARKTKPSLRRSADSRRSRSREPSSRRPRGPTRTKACCPTRESKRRSPAAAPSVRRPVLPASPRVPATSVAPSPAPAAPRDRAAPAPVPAGTPPEFM